METNPGKARTGRKSTFTNARLEKLIAHIEHDGLNYRQACACVGVSESTFRVWRKRRGVAERVEQAREILRANVLAKIKAAGEKDFRANVEFLRLSFPEYRYSNGPSVSVAIQNNVEVSDPIRADLIARREKALAGAAADAPPQLADSADARREEALDAEAKLKDGVIEPAPEPVPERPPRSAVDHAKRLEDREWRIAGRAGRG